MRQTRIRKTTRATIFVDVDRRAPSGRLLPY
jgi:hypothetical protein